MYSNDHDDDYDHMYEDDSDEEEAALVQDLLRLESLKDLYDARDSRRISARVFNELFNALCSDEEDEE